MNETVKTKWVVALRSGQYQQGKGYLKKDGFCCLGVLCDLHAKETGGEWTLRDTEQLPEDPCPVALYRGEEDGIDAAVCAWAGLPEANPQVCYDGLPRGLTGLNDYYCLNFDEIAGLIEDQL